MEIHYTSQKQGREEQPRQPLLHPRSLTLSPSGIAMFASLRFINFVRTNWREKEGRKEFLFGSASFPPAHSAFLLPFIFNLLSTLVGLEEAEFAIYFASLSLRRSSNCFPETSLPIWGALSRGNRARRLQAPSSVLPHISLPFALRSLPLFL